MKRAIIHRHPKDPLYWEISECEEAEVDEIVKKLKSFGSVIILIIKAEDVAYLEDYVAKFGGKPVGLI